jgi:hypothetical protein
MRQQHATTQPYCGSLPVCTAGCSLPVIPKQTAGCSDHFNPAQAACCRTAYNCAQDRMRVAAPCPQQQHRPCRAAAMCRTERRYHQHNMPSRLPTDCQTHHIDSRWLVYVATFPPFVSQALINPECTRLLDSAKSSAA